MKTDLPEINWNPLTTGKRLCTYRVKKKELKTGKRFCVVTVTRAGLASSGLITSATISLRGYWPSAKAAQHHAVAESARLYPHLALVQVTATLIPT